MTDDTARSPPHAHVREKIRAQSVAADNEQHEAERENMRLRQKEHRDKK